MKHINLQRKISEIALAVFLTVVCLYHILPLNVFHRWMCHDEHTVLCASQSSADQFTEQHHHCPDLQLSTVPMLLFNDVLLKPFFIFLNSNYEIISFELITLPHVITTGRSPPVVI